MRPGFSDAVFAVAFPAGLLDPLGGFLKVQTPGRGGGDFVLHMAPYWLNRGAYLGVVPKKWVALPMDGLGPEEGVAAPRASLGVLPASGHAVVCRYAAGAEGAGGSRMHGMECISWRKRLLGHRFRCRLERRSRRTFRSWPSWRLQCISGEESVVGQSGLPKPILGCL